MPNSPACAMRSSAPMSSRPPNLARIRLFAARGRHPAAFHAGQPQGLVQKPLRGHPPTAHQHRQQPPPLRRDPAHQRPAAGADRAQNPHHQPAPRHGADRRLQARPRQRLRQHAAVLHAAVHRQQPHQHLLLRQQPPAALRLQRRGALPAHLPVGRPGQPQDHPPRRLRRDFLPNAPSARCSAATWSWSPASKSC